MQNYNDEKYEMITRARELAEELGNIFDNYDEETLSTDAWNIVDNIDELLKELEADHEDGEVI